MEGATALRFDLRLPMVQYLIHAYRAAIDVERQVPPDYLLMVSEPESLPPTAIWGR
jgi:hypothetical protein